ncbi:peroxisomal membrane protein 13 [Iris pallida]|uniref:Peroxin-13 n=1 Tax=Iris pallida TaxID=29817 RepID=A0AAX6G0Q2_IRIPA|nr:peroxisomal membrane protein 13 [Iris pallida]
MRGVVNFFGRISILIDQNTRALYMFISALLQLFDRSGMLYGELARFVLRLLGFRTKSRKEQQPGPPGELLGPDGQAQRYNKGPKAPSGAWDSVWVMGVLGIPADTNTESARTTYLRKLSNNGNEEAMKGEGKKKNLLSIIRDGK